MNTELFIIFVVLNAANVIIQTAKTLMTVNGGKVTAALANAIAYGLYTVVVVYMVCDLPLWLKVFIVAACNFVGVYVVKFVEERMRKDKLWKIEVTVRKEDSDKLNAELTSLDVPHFPINDVTNTYTAFNCYCKSKKESHFVKELCKRFESHSLVIESEGPIV